MSNRIEVNTRCGGNVVDVYRVKNNEIIKGQTLDSCKASEFTDQQALANHKRADRLSIVFPIAMTIFTAGLVKGVIDRSPGRIFKSVLAGGIVLAGIKRNIDTSKEEEKWRDLETDAIEDHFSIYKTSSRVK